MLRAVILFPLTSPFLLMERNMRPLSIPAAVIHASMAFLAQLGHRHRADSSALTNQIYDRPPSIAQLNVFDG